MRRFRRRDKSEHVGRQIQRSLATLYSDDPVDGGRDLLGRDRLAGQFARVIDDLSQQTESAVVALVGPWGSGKSSLLGQIRTSLSSSDWYLGFHNPWAYSDLTGAVAGFFASLRDAVPEDRLGSEWRATVGDWVSRVAPFGAVSAGFGVDASAPIGAAGALLAGDRSPERLRERAAEGLKTLDHPVLMILDDLDRLSPEELLLTFKLVRLLGRLPNVYYLLAYDEETLIEVLESTDLVGTGTDRAQRYLEKIVQVRLEIPPLLTEQRSTLVNATLDELCRRHSITLPVDASNRLSRAWRECMVDYLDQPRSVKRLFTQVDSLWPEVAGEVDFVDFVAITFLRTFERSTFDLVLTHREELLQLDSGWGLSSQQERPEERWQRWRKLISSTSPKHPDSIANLLSQLFLYLRGARDATSYMGSYAEDVKRRLGVGSREYFDRYVQSGVPDSELRLSMVREAAAELRAGHPGQAVVDFLAHAARDGQDAITKLSRENQIDPIAPSSLLPLLAVMNFPATEREREMFALAPDYAIRRLAAESLDATPIDEAVTLIRELASGSRSSLALAAEVTRSARQDDSDSHEWALSGDAELVGALEATLRSMETGEDSTTQRELTTFLWSYRYFAGLERTRAFVWDLVDSGQWELPVLLGTLIPLGYATNGEQSWTSIGELSAGAIDDLLGIDNLLERIPPDPAFEGDGAVDAFRRVPEGEELSARVEQALLSVERLRRQRTARDADLP